MKEWQYEIEFAESGLCIRKPKRARIDVIGAQMQTVTLRSLKICFKLRFMILNNFSFF